MSKETFKSGEWTISRATKFLEERIRLRFFTKIVRGIPLEERRDRYESLKHLNYVSMFAEHQEVMDFFWFQYSLTDSELDSILENVSYRK